MKYYVSDMDGTLLASGGALSAKTKAGLTDLLNKGLNFTVASARSYTSVKSVFEGVPLKLPIITHDGGLIYDLQNEKPLTFRGLEAQMAKDIYKMAQDMGTHPFLECVYKDNEYFMTENVKNEGMKWMIDYRGGAGAKICVGEHDFNTYGEHLLSFTFIDTAQPLLKLQEKVKALYGEQIKTHFYTEWDCYNWCCLTIHDAKANKGQGIMDLAEILNIHHHHVTVFGDNHNDIAMFTTAGRAVAVENAIPELKSNSHVQIGHHNDDSVYHFLYDEFHAKVIEIEE